MAPPTRLLLAYLRVRHGKALAGLFVLMMAGAVVEGFGLILLVPIVAAIGGDRPDWLPVLPPLPVLLLLFFVAMVVRSILLLVRDRRKSVVENRIIGGMKIGAARSLALGGWHRASGVGQAEMQRIWNSDIPRVGTAIMYGVAAIVAVCFLIVQGLIALALSWRMALVAALLLTLSLALAIPWMRRTTRHGNKLMEAIGSASETGFSLHAGLKSALAEGRALSFLDRYGETVDEESAGYVTLEQTQASSSFVTSTVAAGALCVILYVGIVMLSLPAATMIVLILLFSRMLGPARNLASSIQGFIAYSPAFSILADLLGGEPSPREPIPKAKTKSHTAPASWDRVTARDLRVGPPRIGPLDFTIERGEWVALTGPSGSGKSLLIDTLCGLIPPADGRLEIEGDVDGPRDAAWHAQLSYVGQGDGLVGTSLAAMMGIDTPRADVERVFTALGLDPVIGRLPDGLHSHVGDRGAHISGGERQRIALARALLRRPQLLILDEATVALDLEAEAVLLDAVRRLAPSVTVLFVSHRPQSLDGFDRLFTMPSNAVYPTEN